MLASFKKILTGKGYYSAHHTPLKKHSCGCCKSVNIKVIDFDKMKEEFCQKIGIKHYPKSVDAVFLPKSKDEIYFIEMSSFRDYSTRTGKIGITEVIKYIKKDLKGFGLPNKIIDSIFIVLGIAGYYNVNKNFYSYFLDRTKLKVKTLYVLDLNYRETTLLRRLNRHQMAIKLTKRIEGDINIMSCHQFNTHFKSITPL
jgi:hypothetical protein